MCTSSFPDESSKSDISPSQNTENLPTVDTFANDSSISGLLVGTVLATESPTLLSPAVSSLPDSYTALEIGTLLPDGSLVPDVATKSEVDKWNPPFMEVPMAFHPYDHYWMIRPVGSNYNNFGLSYYPYGSDGPLNDLRIHHGVDLANPIGVEVYAAADGTVIWADKGHFNALESITAYGNVIVIQHKFGYEGQPVYTLYAHLSAILVQSGEAVKSGQVIGLIGNTGQVTGPHVHFEVRVGQDSYYSVRNPALWMAPYVGMGTVAGRVALGNGELMRDVEISLIDRDTGRIVEKTTSYAGYSVASDEKWGENFVFADVPIGRFLVTARFEDITWTAEVNVMPGLTNWVDMIIQSPAEGLPTATP
jgi:murein DD-endopeptidase MepM/ murein hydrolase activator NlpD